MDLRTFFCHKLCPRELAFRERVTTFNNERQNVMRFQITPEFLASQGLSPSFPERFWAKVDKNGPLPQHMKHLGRCWVWTAFKQQGGYGKVWQSMKTNTFLLAHVASWILHHGKKPTPLCVLHKCDHPPCIRPSHLFRGTKQDNSDDAKKKGRSNNTLKGDANPTSKLTSAQVLRIRKLYAAGGISQLNLAKQYGVCERNIFFIVHRIHWSHI